MLEFSYNVCMGFLKVLCEDGYKIKNQIEFLTKHYGQYAHVRRENHAIIGQDAHS